MTKPESMSKPTCPLGVNSFKFACSVVESGISFVNRQLDLDWGLLCL